MWTPSAESRLGLLDSIVRSVEMCEAELCCLGHRRKGGACSISLCLLAHLCLLDSTVTFVFAL